MALASHTPLSTELSEFDEMLITKNIATREACLKCKGFTAEQVAEIMAGDEEELEAETSMKLAAVIVNDEAGANGGDDDDSYEDSPLTPTTTSVARGRRARARSHPGVHVCADSGHSLKVNSRSSNLGLEQKFSEILLLITGTFELLFFSRRCLEIKILTSKKKRDCGVEIKVVTHPCTKG